MSEVDYVIGTAMPFLVEEPRTPRDANENFTVSEAAQHCLVGKPVFMNHHDSPRDPYRVGQVLGERMGAGAKDVLLSLTTATPESRIVSRRVAVGTYKGLSVGHRYGTVKCSDNSETTVKTTDEVSVCKEGLRYGSTIGHYFPSTRTLQSMEDADIVTTAQHFHYAAELAQGGHDISRRNEYIAAFATLAQERLAGLASTFMSDPAPPQATTPQPDGATAVKASDTAPPEESVHDTPPPVQEQAPTDPSGQRGVTLEDLQNPQRAAERLEEMAKQNAELAAKYTAQQEEFTRLKAAEQERKVVEDAKLKDQQDKAAADARYAIKSFMESAPKAGMARAEIDGYVETFNELMQSDPIKANKYITPVAMTAVKASKTMQEANDIQRRQYEDSMARAAQTADQRLLLEKMNRINAFSAQTNFERHFQDPVSPATSQTAVKASANPPAPEPTKAVQVAPPTSVSDKNAQWALEEYVFQQTHGIQPTYDSISAGMEVAKTGRVKASASGELVEETEVRWGNKRRGFGLEQWAPNLHENISKRVRLARQGPIGCTSAENAAS